jgi:hypothetical protein
MDYNGTHGLINFNGTHEAIMEQVRLQWNKDSDLPCEVATTQTDPRGGGAGGGEIKHLGE